MTILLYLLSVAGAFAVGLAFALPTRNHERRAYLDGYAKAMKDTHDRHWNQLLEDCQDSGFLLDAPVRLHPFDLPEDSSQWN